MTTRLSTSSRSYWRPPGRTESRCEYIYLSSGDTRVFPKCRKNNVLTWTCCMCGDGTMTWITNFQCLSCGHIRCTKSEGNCKIHQNDARPEHGWCRCTECAPPLEAGKKVSRHRKPGYSRESSRKRTSEQSEDDSRTQIPHNRTESRQRGRDCEPAGNPVSVEPNANSGSQNLSEKSSTSLDLGRDSKTGLPSRVDQTAPVSPLSTSVTLEAASTSSSQAVPLGSLSISPASYYDGIRSPSSSSSSAGHWLRKEASGDAEQAHLMHTGSSNFQRSENSGEHDQSFRSSGENFFECYSSTFSSDWSFSSSSESLQSTSSSERGDLSPPEAPSSMVEASWLRNYVGALSRFLETCGFQRQAGYDANHQQGAGGVESHSSSQKLPSTTQGKSEGDPKKKRRPDDDDGGDDDDDDQKDSPNPHGAKKTCRDSKVPERKLACPFYKKDPIRHRACCNFKSNRINHIKGHILRRTHRLGKPDGVTVEQDRRLSEKVSAGLSLADQWFWVWDRLFPSWQRPSSPYVDFSSSVEAAQIRHFLQNDCRSILTRLLNDGGRAPEDTTVGERVEQVTQDIMLQWDAQWQPLRGDEPQVLAATRRAENNGETAARGENSTTTPADLNAATFAPGYRELGEECAQRQYVDGGTSTNALNSREILDSVVAGSPAHEESTPKSDVDLGNSKPCHLQPELFSDAVIRDCFPGTLYENGQPPLWQEVDLSSTGWQDIDFGDADFQDPAMQDFDWEAFDMGPGEQGSRELPLEFLGGSQAPACGNASSADQETPPAELADGTG